LHLFLFVVKSEYKRNELLPAVCIMNFILKLRTQQQGKQMFLTQKQADFCLFKNIVELVLQKHPLKLEGLIKILELRAPLNKGFSPELEKAFPNIIPVARPFDQVPVNIDKNWFVGFIDGVGSFFVKITKGKTKIRFLVQIIFNLTQHIRDAGLFKFIQGWLGCGLIYEIHKESRVNLVIMKIQDIINILIPILNQNPLPCGLKPKGHGQGLKRLKFEDFKLVVELLPLVLQTHLLPVACCSDFYCCICSIYLLKKIVTKLTFACCPFCICEMKSKWARNSKGRRWYSDLKTKNNHATARGETHKQALLFALAAYMQQGRQEWRQQVRPEARVDGQVIPECHKRGKPCKQMLIEKKEHLTLDGLNKIRQIKSGLNKGRMEIKFNANTIISPTPHYHNCGGTGHSPYSRSLLKSSHPTIIQKREFHHKVKARNRIGPHNNDTLSIIFGSLLGNGKMKTKVEGCMLVVRETNNEYAQWLNTFFYTRGYTSNLQPIQCNIPLKSKEGTVYSGYEFHTFTFRSFSWIHDLFYNKGRKVIPPKISEYLTPIALAV
jgi:hypothetical protein